MWQDSEKEVVDLQRRIMCSIYEEGSKISTTLP